MTPLREAAGYALANLHDVMKEAEAMDSAAERRAAIQALCAESEAASLKASAELKASQDELGRVSADLKAKSRILDDLRDRSTAELDARIAEARGELSGLQVRIDKTRREIAESDASMGSLIRRLRIG
jgi:uncharacterized coiled-coil DUF342 family protein